MKLYKFIEAKPPKRVALSPNSAGVGLPSGDWLPQGEIVVVPGQKGRIGMSDDDIIAQINRDGFVVM